MTINRALVASVLALVVAFGLARPAAQSRAEVALRAAIETETIKGDLKSAISQYEALSKNADRAIAAKALLRLAGCYEKLGQADASGVYARIVEQFRDQPNEAADAGRRLAAVRAGSSADTVSTTRIASKRDGRVYGSTVSRDGRYIAWTWGDRLGVLDLASGDDRFLLRTVAANPTRARISPDGRLVAYEFSGRVRIIGADGGGDRELMAERPTGYGRPPAVLDWSSDSKYVFVALNAGGGRGARGTPDSGPVANEIRLISIADGSTARTFPVESAVPDGHISPDGRYVLLAGPIGGVRILSIGDGSVNSVGADSPAFWTPTGNRILSQRVRRTDAGPTLDLWSVKIVNGKAAGDPEFHQKDVQPIIAATADGGYFYRAGNSTRDIYAVDIDPANGQRVGRPRQLTSIYDSRAPSWSPDGARLAYFTFGGGLTAASRLTVDTPATARAPRVLEPQQTGFQFQPNPRVAPQWFPDNRSILVYYPNGTLGRVDVETREFTPVLPGVTIPVDYDDLYASKMRMSHDGRALYYFPREPNEPARRLVCLDLETGASTEVARVPGNNTFGLAVSPDDRQIAFIIRPQGAEAPTRAIMVVDAKGGIPRTVHTSRDVGTKDIAWGRDGRRLFYATWWGRPLADNVIDMGADIWTVGIDGSDPRPLGIGLSDQYYLNIHPNGRQLIWMEENFRNELWVLRLPAALTGK